VLDACSQNRVGRLVYTSTVGVYGNTPGAKTEDTPLAPQTEYEKSKAEAEQLVIASQELVPYTILRSALVIGPNSYWKQIIQVVQKNIPLIGESNNPWQTVYYKDLANAVVFFLFLDTAENETFIVAGEDRPSLTTLVETLRSQLGLPNPAPKIHPFLGQVLVAVLGLWMKIQGKPNILSKSHLQRLFRERSYDLTKIHAYGWKAKFTHPNALKETLQAIRN